MSLFFTAGGYDDPSSIDLDGAASVDAKSPMRACPVVLRLGSTVCISSGGYSWCPRCGVDGTLTVGEADRHLQRELSHGLLVVSEVGKGTVERCA
jgi:hypothetical protein